MNTMRFAVAAVLALGLAARVEARPLVASDRFVTLQQGEVEVGLDAVLGVSAGRAGEQAAVATGYRHDRHGGLSVAVGVTDEVEAGATVSVVKWDRSLGREFGGVEMYGTWGFLPILGVEAGVLVAGFSRADGGPALHPALRVGLPFRLTLIESVLAVFSRTDFLIGLRRDRTGAEWFTDLGCTVNITPWFFVEAYAGLSKALAGGGAEAPLFGGTGPDRDPLAMPVGLGAGVTLFRRLDVFASFNFEDLRNRMADARNLVLSVAARF